MNLFTIMLAFDRGVTPGFARRGGGQLADGGQRPQTLTRATDYQKDVESKIFSVLQVRVCMENNWGLIKDISNKCGFSVRKVRNFWVVLEGFAQ